MDHGFLSDHAPAFGDMIVEDGAEVGALERPQRLVDGPDEIMAQIGHQAAECVGQAGPRRNENVRDAQLPREGGCVQWARTSECEQREVARIVTSRQGDEPDRAGHLVVRDAQDGGCRRLDIEIQDSADLVADCPRHIG